MPPSAVGAMRARAARSATSGRDCASARTTAILSPPRAPRAPAADLRERGAAHDRAAPAETHVLERAIHRLQLAEVVDDDGGRVSEAGAQLTRLRGLRADQQHERQQQAVSVTRR